FFSSRRRHTRFSRDWSSDVCSSDLSFARTYEVHGSDRAIIAGLLDMKTDDKRIKDALVLAPEEGVNFRFKSVGNASTLHPNTIRSEERRVGKECDARWRRYSDKARR